MKKTYVDILGSYFDELEDDLAVSENKLKKVMKIRKRPIEHKIRK